MKIQLIWWWRLPTIMIWQYPRKPSEWYYSHTKTPFFYGLYLGICEIRFMPKAGKFIP